MSHKMCLMQAGYCKMYEEAKSRALQYVLLDARMKNQRPNNEEMMQRVEQRIPIEMKLLNIEVFSNI